MCVCGGHILKTATKHNQTTSTSSRNNKRLVTYMPASSLPRWWPRCPDCSVKSAQKNNNQPRCVGANYLPSYQVKRSQHSCVGANYLPGYQVKRSQHSCVGANYLPSYQVKRSQHSCVGANYLPSYQVKRSQHSCVGATSFQATR